MKEANGNQRSGPKTLEEKQRLVAAFLNRNESTTDFARRHGVGVSTLHQWTRAQRGSRRKTNPSVSFREVALPVEGMSPWTVEVCLPDGTRVRWNAKSVLSDVQVLIQQLRGSC